MSWTTGADRFSFIWGVEFDRFIGSFVDEDGEAFAEEGFVFDDDFKDSISAE